MINKYPNMGGAKLLINNDDRLKEVRIALRMSQMNFINDPNTSLIKLRQGLEMFIDYLLIENNFKSSNELFDSIQVLRKSNVINDIEVDLFHGIRKTGNKAIHEMYENVEETRQLLTNFYMFYNEFILKKNQNNLNKEPKNESEEDNDTYKNLVNKDYEEVLLTLLVTFLRENGVVTSDYNSTPANKNIVDMEQNRGFYISFSSGISNLKNYQMTVIVSNGYINIISDPIVEQVMEFEKHMYINLINYMNSKTLRSCFYFDKDNVKVKTVLYYNKDDYENITEISFDIFHSITALVRDIKEMFEILTRKKRV